MTQLAEAVLTKVFQGEEAFFGERDVVWGQDGKETAGDWTKVVPVQGPLPPLWDQKGPRKPPPVPVPPVSRPSRLRPPPRPSSSSSSSSSSGASSGSSSAEAVGEASGEDRRPAEPEAGGAGGGVEGAMASGGGGDGDGDGGGGSGGGGSESSSASGIVNLGAKSVSSGGKRPALASRGSANITTAAPGAATAPATATVAGERVPEGEAAAGGDVSDAARPASWSDAAAAAAAGSTRDAEAAASAGEVDSEGSFVLLVLEGSITAEYGLDEEEKERQARALRDASVTRRGKPVRKVKVPPRSRKDRVLGKGATHGRENGV